MVRIILIALTVLFLGLNIVYGQNTGLEDQGPQVGGEFPDFLYETLDGVEFDFSSIKGEVVVINIWFVGCTGCKQEEPYLKEVAQKYKHRGDVIFLGFAMSSPSKIRKYLDKNGDYGFHQISLTRKEVKEKFNVVISPSHFIIKDGKLLSKFIGAPLVPHTSALNLFQEELEKAILGTL